MTTDVARNIRQALPASCAVVLHHRSLRVRTKRAAQQNATGRERAQTSIRARRLPSAVAIAETRAAVTSSHSSPQNLMTTAALGDPPPSPSLLGPVLGNLPADLVQQEVLRRLGPRALASLAGTGRGCAAAVAATALMQWATLAKRTSVAYGLIQRFCVQTACSIAACYGNQGVLEWLHNTGCPWDVVTAFAAARGGHLEVLKWAREHGCPWDEVTCARAAEGGHLAVLQWAREHHCPWNSIVCLSAAVTGQLEVLQWVRENDATGEVWSERRVRNYAKWPRKQEVLTWLNQLSAP